MIVLIGASGHAKVIIDILEKQEQRVDYLVDADPNITSLAGYKVKRQGDFKPEEATELIVSIGSNDTRKKVAEQFKGVFTWAIHPSVILGDEVSIGGGTVVMAGAIVNSASSIGNHVIINTSASVDHDCIIEDYCHISPNATLCGSITVGEGSQVGAGATIIPNLKIGKWATIGAGSVIIRDVPDKAIVVGNPGRIIGYNE